METMLSSLESSDDSKEFMVIDIVVMFCRREGLEKVRTWVPFSIGISLEKDGTQCIFGCISGNSKGGGEIRDMQDGFEEEEVFNMVEGVLLGGCPTPGEVFLG